MKGIDPELLKSLVQLTLPDEPSLFGWTINRKETTYALKILEIKLPVQISLQKYRVHKGGWYQWGICRTSKPGIHRVRINREASANFINQVLWHELVHAMQAERFARMFDGVNAWDFYNKAYKLAQGPYGASYADNLYEKEAEDLSKAYSQEYMLINDPIIKD